MLPEISHRCAACGVTIRDRAMFCPQCGKPVEKKSSAESTQSDTIALDADKAKTMALDPGRGKTMALDADISKTMALDDDPAKTMLLGSQTIAESASKTVMADPNQTIAETADADREASQQGQPKNPTDSGTAVQRTATPARAALSQNVMPRVEKLRKASTVVIDEAAYDPSLRFILIAALLFLMFVVIMVLSKWIS